MAGRQKDARSGFSLSSTALHEVLGPEKEAIAARWTALVHGTYPFDTVGFLRTKSDPFANPVGARTSNAAAALVSLLFSERPDEEAIRTSVDDIIQIRAIQQFSPEGAVGIFFAMKDIVREKIKNSGRLHECAEALLDFESRLDAVALMAFGAYARDREKLHLLRVEEMRRSTSQLRRLVERHASQPKEE